MKSLFQTFFVFAWSVTSTASFADEGTDFFEKKIRPVLVAKCYSCHSADAVKKRKFKGGLQLDTRAGIRAGGESGPAVVPGDAAKSLIIDSIRRESFEMPPNEKLPDRVVADFVRWIEIGAPDPRDGELVATMSKLASIGPISRQFNNARSIFALYGKPCSSRERFG